MTKRSEHTRFQAWMDASFKDMLRFNANRILHDTRIPALWIVEVLLSVSIAIAIGLYLDPDVNVVPVPWNYVAFAVLVGIALLIHRRTRPFRVSHKLRKQLIKK